MSGTPVSLTIATRSFQELLSGNLLRDITEIRDHVAYMQRLLTDSQKNSIVREFGALLASERNL
jgi:hypothetical protein